MNCTAESSTEQHGPCGTEQHGLCGTEQHGPCGTEQHGPCGTEQHGPCGTKQHGPCGTEQHGPCGTEQHGPCGTMSSSCTALAPPHRPPRPAPPCGKVPAPLPTHLLCMLCWVKSPVSRCKASRVFAASRTPPVGASRR